MPKCFILCLILLFLASGGHLLAKPNKDLHIYLLIGQSNMSGRAPFNEEESKILKNCYLLNDKGEWTPAKNPFNIYSTIRKGGNIQKMNPGYTFCKTMLQKDSKLKLGLVVNAKGGSKIRQWKKGTRFYEEAIKRTQQAMKTGTLKGILWHQGEGDRSDSNYLVKLKTLIENFRKDFNQPKLPFVAGGINKIKSFNNLVIHLPNKVPYTGFASSEGLTAMDKWHFDNKSMKILGERYASEMIRIQSGKKYSLPK